MNSTQKPSRCCTSKLILSPLKRSGDLNFASTASEMDLDTFLRRLSLPTRLVVSFFEGQTQTIGFDLRGSTSALRQIGAIPPPRSAAARPTVSEGPSTVAEDSSRVVPPSSVATAPGVTSQSAPPLRSAAATVAEEPSTEAPSRIVPPSSVATAPGATSENAPQASADPLAERSLAGLSPEMRDLVNASCSTEAGYKDNSVEWRERYYRCLATNTRESGALGAEPSLAGLSPEMRDLVNASCSTEAGYKDNSVEWRERYYRCLATGTLGQVWWRGAWCGAESRGPQPGDARSSEREL